MAAALAKGRLRDIARCFARLRLGVVGDFFLDAYYDCDPGLQEISLETGKACHQVVRTRRQAGAAGTVATNLKALGVGTVEAVGFCGEDGEGFELRRAMAAVGLDTRSFVSVADRFTPTYGKPCAVASAAENAPGRKKQLIVIDEMERLDIKNRRPTPVALQQQLMEFVRSGLDRWDGLIVVDQANEPNCGVVTTRVRRFLSAEAERRPDLIALVDSRERIGQFRHLMLKPNQREAAAAMGAAPNRSPSSARTHAQALARRARRPVFLTRGADGMLVAQADDVTHVPGFPVPGPIDPVGAGDSTSAALLASTASGATLEEAAVIANLVGSVTVQQLGTTGTASPRQLLKRYDEVFSSHAA